MVTTFQLRDGSGTIRLQYITEDTDRHGNVRLYVRRPGAAKIRLREKPGTEAFMAEYKDALAGVTAQRAAGKTPPGATLPDSLKWLCQEYYTSAQFKRLNERTRHVRRLILDGFCLERDKGNLNGPPHGDKPFRLMKPRHIRKFMDDRADRPEAANSLVKALRQIYAYAVERDLMDANPAKEVSYLSSANPDGHHAWTVEEIRQYEAVHPVGSMARLALALLLYTGQRRSDVVQIAHQQIKGGRLALTQTKGRSRKPVTINIPLHPQLQAVIDATPGTGPTLLSTEFGKPFTVAGFGNRFRKWCTDANLPHCSAHGLRKALSALLAEAGAGENEIMAVTGHTTSKEVLRYTRSARRKLMADNAISRLKE